MNNNLYSLKWTILSTYTVLPKMNNASYYLKWTTILHTIPQSFPLIKISWHDYV